MKKSPENMLIYEDVKRSLYNAFIFSLPWLVAILASIGENMTIKQAVFTSMPVLINLLMDLWRKYKEEDVY